MEKIDWWLKIKCVSCKKLVMVCLSVSWESNRFSSGSHYLTATVTLFGSRMALYGSNQALPRHLVVYC